MTTTLSTHDTLVALRRELDVAVDPVRLFARLTAGGTRPGSILLESGELAPTYAERSIGIFCPAIVATGKGTRFTLRALDDRGRVWLNARAARIRERARVTRRSPDVINGRALPDESGRYRPPGHRTHPHLDVLRTLLPGSGRSEAAGLPVGLYGCFAYDFVRQFEAVPAAAEDRFGDPDYELFLGTRGFIVDHIEGRTVMFSVVPAQHDRLIAEAREDLERMSLEVRAIAGSGARATSAIPDASAGRSTDLVSDTPKEDYCRNVERLKQDILDGRVYQVVYGRTLSTPYLGDSVELYRRLAQLNPSPYQFFVRGLRGTLLGASPELAVRVRRQGVQRIVEIKPIAGTAPRGRVRGGIDADLDARYETALRCDAKEISEHAMLIDLARNDVAGICEPGSTRLNEAFAVEKFSHVQHLVSRVTGVLRPDIDAIGAYAATMNMGTLTGAPKPEAMRLIAQTEATARGLFGGGVGFIDSNGEMETAIVIRAIRIHEHLASIRAGAGIVADSIPEQEWDETERKAQACVQAIRETNHVQT